MYKRDQKVIGLYGAQGPDQMARVMVFVLTTIQQSIQSTPDQMREIDELGEDSKYLWGFKQAAYLHLMERKEIIYAALYNLECHDPYEQDTQRLLFMADLYGFGLVKGGFVLQLLFGSVGCLDSHNQGIFEIPESAFKASRFKNGSVTLKKRLTQDYLDLCEDIGGSEFLWDRWCEHVAQNNFTTADAISALHTEALGL